MSPEKQLTGRTATGAGLLVASRLITRGIDVLALLFLGRILSPADFGLLAIAMTVIFIVEAIMEMPVSMALIRLPTLTRAHFDTAFTLSFLRGAALALIVSLCAFPFSKIYNDPRLLPLICALSFAPALRGMLSPRMAEFAQQLDFRREMIVDLAGKTLSFAVSVGLAWATKSYWAIAAGTITTTFVMFVTSYILAPYRPRFSLSEWPHFSSLIGWTVASQSINAFSWQTAQLFIGKLFGPVALGHYMMATNVATLPYQVLTAQTMRPLLAAYSLIREDRDRLRSAYLLSCAAFMTICIPAMVGLSVLSHPVFELFLGAKWHEAADILSWLAFMALLAMLNASMGPLAMSLNRANIFVWISLAELCMKLTFIFLLPPIYGMTGLLVSLLITALVSGIAAIFVVRHLIQLPIRRQLANLWRPTFSSVMMVLAILPFRAGLSGAEGLQLVLGLGSVVALGVIVYVGVLVTSWRLAGCPHGVETKVLDMLKPLRFKFLPST